MKDSSKPKRFDCSKCSRYHSCTKLCDKAQKYAQQDFVYLREIPNPSPEGEKPWMSAKKIRPAMTDREIVVNTLLLCHVPHKTIRNVLKIQRYAFKSMVYRLRKKMYN